MQIKCEINHKEYEIECSPTDRVLDILRAHGFLSVKEGCGGGECGACSIILNKKLVNACLLIAIQMQDSKILTLEGLESETHDIKDNFIKEGAIQCGFCTSGFVLRSYDYISNGGVKDEKTIKESLDGNLCRCTGYQKIVEAILKSMR